VSRLLAGDVSRMVCGRVRGCWRLRSFEGRTVRLLGESRVDKNLANVNVLLQFCVVQLDTDDVVTVPGGHVKSRIKGRHSVSST